MQVMRAGKDKLLTHTNSIIKELDQLGDTQKNKRVD
jgi:hypothetical protein